MSAVNVASVMLSSKSAWFPNALKKMELPLTAFYSKSEIDVDSITVTKRWKFFVFKFKAPNLTEQITS